MNDEVCPWKMLCTCLQRAQFNELTRSLRREYAIRGSATFSPHIHYIKVRAQRLLSYRLFIKRYELGHTILFVDISQALLCARKRGLIVDNVGIGLLHTQTLGLMLHVRAQRTYNESFLHALILESLITAIIGGLL